MINKVASFCHPVKGHEGEKNLGDEVFAASVVDVSRSV